MGDARIDVVGGGFSGMAAAWYLQKAGARVRLFERGTRLGGLISTLYTSHGLVEQAASGLVNSREVERLFTELELELYPTIKKYPRRYIYRGAPRLFPLRGWEWLKGLKAIRESLRDFRGVKPHAGETLRDWSLRHWGPSITDAVVEPAFRGVFAGSADRLSATLVLSGMMNRLPSTAGPKGTVAPLAGMGELINCWTVQLLCSGVEIHLNSDWSDDGRAQKVVLCLSPQESGRVLADKDDSEFLEQLKALPRVGLASLTAFFDPSPEDLKGFGALSPVHDGLGAMGVLFSSDIFWQRNSGLRSERYIFSEDWLNKSDQELLDQALKDRRLLEKSTGKLRGYHVARHPAALPLYGLQLEHFLSANKLSRGKYELFGNSYGNLGLARILAAAKIHASKWVAEVSHG